MHLTTPNYPEGSEQININSMMADFGRVIEENGCKSDDVSIKLFGGNKHHPPNHEDTITITDRLRSAIDFTFPGKIVADEVGKAREMQRITIDAQTGKATVVPDGKSEEEYIV